MPFSYLWAYRRFIFFINEIHHIETYKITTQNQHVNYIVAAVESNRGL